MIGPSGWSDKMATNTSRFCIGFSLLLVLLAHQASALSKHSYFSLTDNLYAVDVTTPPTPE
jgi:hypothetical protein